MPAVGRPDEERERERQRDRDRVWKTVEATTERGRLRSRNVCSVADVLPPMRKESHRRTSFVAGGRREEGIEWVDKKRKKKKRRLIFNISISYPFAIISAMNKIMDVDKVPWLEVVVMGLTLIMFVFNTSMLLLESLELLGLFLLVAEILSKLGGITGGTASTVFRSGEFSVSLGDVAIKEGDLVVELTLGGGEGNVLGVELVIVLLVLLHRAFDDTAGTLDLKLEI
ncbi:hypothetical protein GCK72_024981 [Caenorhabditis remanei]|uniref:Uncharacterized protein n=1 Tax=Caenorhabditis remanei TaxID=31234 RepID=A0A6A5G1L3_CAERE|nr:hypothetical protein GCK72_024981 [Caenorhabditis remanei]KAF1748514.1 hypothetical protein GCK72_024981 [Caenorhabditis remanei]